MKNRRDREIPPNSKEKRDRVMDLTGIKPVKKRNTVRSGLGDYSSSNSNSNNVIFMAIPEQGHKGLEEQEDEYAKYDQMWDGQADEQIIASGATIIRSEIEITDSQGRNRKLVRRDSEAFHY
jgi:hypothetical protein